MNETFNTDIKELKELRNMIKELEAEATAIEDRVKAAMLDSGKQEVFTAEYKVTYKPITSTRFDSKSFKAAHSDLYTAFSKTTTYNRLTVA
ncbi:MAG: hypothetical protein LUD77_02005 [Clostridiales bacterium]|nr:hypothetical protein [Clostridiales bacterium]